MVFVLFCVFVKFIKNNIYDDELVKIIKFESIRLFDILFIEVFLRVFESMKLFCIILMEKKLILFYWRSKCFSFFVCFCDL